MSAPIGSRQIKKLRGMAHYGLCQIIGDEITSSLCKRGLMTALGSDGESFIIMTAAGYRAVGDALDAGTIKLASLDDYRHSSPLRETERE